MRTTPFGSIRRSFPHWDVYVSDNIAEGQYGLGQVLRRDSVLSITTNRDLHLAVSLRSFRSEKVAALVESLLDCDTDTALSLSLDILQSFANCPHSKPGRGEEL